MTEKDSSHGLSSKSTQGEIEVKDTNNFMTSVDQTISNPGQVKI